MATHEKLRYNARLVNKRYTERKESYGRIRCKSPQLNLLRLCKVKSNGTKHVVQIEVPRLKKVDSDSIVPLIFFHMEEVEITFDQWLHKVCERISLRTRKEITEVFSSIDLTDAKLAFMDGESPESYEPWFPW